MRSPKLPAVEAVGFAYLLLEGWLFPSGKETAAAAAVKAVASHDCCDLLYEFCCGNGEDEVESRYIDLARLVVVVCLEKLERNGIWTTSYMLRGIWRELVRLTWRLLRQVSHT